MKIIRLILKIIAVLLVLAMIVLAVFLVPQHMQIREVEPAIPEIDQLQTLKSQENGPVKISYINTSSQVVQGSPLGHTVFLAEWADGRTFMIDAGMDRAQAKEFAELLKTIASAGDLELHGTLPDLMGGAVGRVTGVGFTHLHIDHSQGIVPFCKARGDGAALYQTDFQRDQHNRNTADGAALIKDSCLATGKLAGKTVQTIAGFPGLGVIAAGGHTPGSTIFVIAVEGHLWVFAGDITNSKANLLNTGKGFLYSTFFVPEHTARLEKLRLWLAKLDARDDTTVIVSHDIDDIKTSGLAEFGR